MVAGGADWFSVYSLVPRARERQAAYYSRLADRATPDYPKFLAEVCAKTPPGSTVAIVVPRGWDEGYRYAYYRAVYLLEGRRALPVVWKNRQLPENLRSADYVAAWRISMPRRPFEPEWSGFSGTLYRRSPVGKASRLEDAQPSLEHLTERVPGRPNDHNMIVPDRTQ